jgi:hypothetical protein
MTNWTEVGCHRRSVSMSCCPGAGMRT